MICAEFSEFLSVSRGRHRRVGFRFVHPRFVSQNTGTRSWNWTVRSPQCMDMVVKIMQAGVPTQFDLEKYSTPLLRHWRDKGRKRSANEAFLKAADALDDLELSPRIKRVVRRPPPALTIYVRRETEKAYNAIMLEEITVESLKLAVSEKYNTPTNSIDSFMLRCKEGWVKSMVFELFTERKGKVWKWKAGGVSERVGRRVTLVKVVSCLLLFFAVSNELTVNARVFSFP